MRKFNRGNTDQFVAALESRIDELENTGIASATNTTNIAISPDADVINADGDERERYLHTLIGDIQRAVPNQLSAVFDNDENNLYVTINNTDAEDADVTEFTVPFEDLKFDFNRVDDDVDYIIDHINEHLAIEEAETIEASHNDVDFFGQAAAEQFGDLIEEELKGKVISKRRDISEEPGGLIYEAQQLGIDMWDLLEALEGMCHDGRVREISDSEYLVVDTDSVDEEDIDIDEEIESTMHVHNKNGYEYILKHGFGPGTLPKGVAIEDFEDWDNGYTMVTLDRPLTDEEIDKYDIIIDTGDKIRKQYSIKSGCGKDVKGCGIKSSFGQEVIDYEPPYDADRFERIDHKIIYEDGFTTDYTLYFDHETGIWFCMYGDEELYTPDPDYADAEFDDEATAREWFENYQGIDEDDVDEAFIEDIDIDEDDVDDDGEMYNHW